MRLRGYDLAEVLEREEVAKGTFRIRISRDRYIFKPGQSLSLALVNGYEARDYSIYSSVHDPFLEVLIQRVPEGSLSPKLCALSKGESLQISKPHGMFLGNLERLKPNLCLFVATGTGIAPFHSLVSSYPNIDYNLIHGIRFSENIYAQQSFEKTRRLNCLSRELCAPHFFGRVTDYLRIHKVFQSANVFLCGHSAMIKDVRNIVRTSAESIGNIQAEVYY